MKAAHKYTMTGLIIALLSTLLVALVLSYLYPVLIGGANALHYFKASTQDNSDAWRLVGAVFLVASAATTSVFAIVTLCALLPLFRAFPRLAEASVYTYFLLGAGASLLVSSLCWLGQNSLDLMSRGDYFFVQVGIIIDGPIAMLVFWLVQTRMRDGHHRAT